MIGLGSTIANSTDVNAGGDCRDLWWKTYYTSTSSRFIHSKQKDFVELLKNCGDVSHLPAGAVVGCTVRDPRLFLPKKKFLICSNTETAQKNEGT